MAEALTIWTFDWVQWNGSAQQPMARNIGEALGVGATLTFFDTAGQPLKGDARYPSSVRVRDLHLIEETLQRLKPPSAATRTARRSTATSPALPAQLARRLRPHTTARRRNPPHRTPTNRCARTTLN